MAQTWSHRRILAAIAWITEDLNNPSRDNWYMMAVAAEVRRSWVKDKHKVSPADFILPLVAEPKMKPKKVKPTPAPTLPAPPPKAQLQAAIDKARWVKQVGGGQNVIHLVLTKEEAEKIRAMPLDEASRYKRQLAEERGLVPKKPAKPQALPAEQPVAPKRTRRK